MLCSTHWGTHTVSACPRGQLPLPSSYQFLCRLNSCPCSQVDPKPRDVLLHIVSFDIPIKYICPMALLGLFVNQIIFDATKYDNGYENYPNWLHGVAGGVVLGVMVFSLLIFAIYPDFWDVMGVDQDQGAQVAYYAVRAAMDCCIRGCLLCFGLPGCL